MDSLTNLQQREFNDKELLLKNEKFIKDANLNSQYCKDFRESLSDQIQKTKETNSNPNHLSLLLIHNQSLMYSSKLNDNVAISHRNAIQPFFGALLKKSPHWIQGYKLRQCSIINRVFRYFSAETHKLEGVLNFDVQTYQLIDIKDKQGNVIEFIIKPVGKIEKVFQFKGSNFQETTKWFQIIQLHLQDSFGTLNKLTSLCLYEKFWRHERISAQQLDEEAEDGDLLLFRGKSFNCQLQRALTQNDYDHIGLLIKIEPDRLFIFESLPTNGVSLCEWKTFNTKEWYKLYEKIVYRRLKANRSAAFKTKLLDFVTNNLGKEFSCAPSKLLLQNSTTLGDVNLEAAKQFNRTYFCSELIAKSYKTLGFLPKSVSSTQYWPGSFSQKNPKLKLEQAELSDEFLIDFCI
ncbi:unnamed protein product (macronuclear) [Paramecium tetraurelia]|uniref:PH domain-containing protein n=1 Tax=Paramecium tetraurelia TaxID=5888 RepID=A0D0S0_PARTE|nr:uncharacterized protein GSPATT00012189001 [Paramecium tetraurelia]CAK76637.1 unnamed protein product [Paramecium tetraurelia]|eukprot:XP_001444034.1 hypothetical protein (macronuclear) [Paramecium tetraurelia strain d4-2]